MSANLIPSICGGRLVPSLTCQDGQSKGALLTEIKPKETEERTDK